MKMKKMFFLSSLSTFMIAPLSIVSCSNNSSNENLEFISYESTLENYSNVFNELLPPQFLVDKENKNNPNLSTYNMKLSEFENIINNQIDNNNKIKKLMKIYCFYFLYQGIAFPYTRDGKKVTNLNENLTNFRTLLQDKMKADNPDIEYDDKKTYKNFDKFINLFENIKINFFYFEIKDNNDNNNNNEIKVINNKDTSIGEIVNNKQTLYQLMYQISFKVNDDEVNKKIIDTNSDKSIFFQTNKNRDDLKIIKKYKGDQEINNIISNQYLYQGTKIYYEDNVFKTIILPSNIQYKSNFSTIPSGFTTSDKERNSSYFDFIKESSKTYKTWFIINLSSSSYFDANLTVDFNRYLKWNKLINNDKMKKIEFELDQKIKI